MLNPNFNEKKLNFSHWSDFVSAAVKAGFVTIEGKGPESLIYPVARVLKTGGALCSMPSRSSSMCWANWTRGIRRATIPYRNVNSKLIEKKIYFNGLGFNQFKGFIQAAESRGLVQSKVEGLKHSVRRVLQDETPRTPLQ